MKNENTLILIVLAVLAFVFLRQPAQAASVNASAGRPNLPDQNSNLDASDLIQVARDSLDWASKTFGGWGNDLPTGTSETGVDAESGAVYDSGTGE